MAEIFLKNKIDEKKFFEKIRKKKLKLIRKSQYVKIGIIQPHFFP